MTKTTGDGLTPQARYDAKNCVSVHLKLNKVTDADILARLESVDSKQGYIKSLIRDDISKEAEGMKIIGSPESGFYYKVVPGAMPFVRVRYTTAEARASHGYRSYEDFASEAPVPAVKEMYMVHKSMLPARFRAGADKDGFVCEEEIVFWMNGAKMPETESENLTFRMSAPYAAGKLTEAFVQSNPETAHGGNA